MPTISKTPGEAGQQITRAGYQWGTILGQAVGPITFGFRQTAPTYNTSPHDEQSSFEQFTAKQIEDATAALSLWSDLANISFVRIGAGTSGEAAFTDNATIVFGGYYSDHDGGAAFAFYADATDLDPQSAAGDVWVNRYYDERTTTPETYRFMTLLHEIGHALGLQHPGNYNAGGGAITYANSAEYIEDSRQYTVMSYWSAANTGAYHTPSLYAGTPLLHDIVAIQRLYGANLTTRTDDTIYGFNSNTEQDAFHLDDAKNAPIFAVWDAGGIDTFDFSGFAQNQVIDLREGMFSNVGPLTGNVAIAPGAVIENAIGGSGDDVVIGNDAENTLLGNRGRDILIGEAGDDILNGGAGRDRLQGGDGADVFVFDLSRGKVRRDVILDFNIAEGDKIDLAAIDARRHASGDQSFHYIGGQGFTGHTGELRFKHGMVEGDINGDGSADFRIRVHAATADDGVATLAARTSFHRTADDFIL